MFVGSHYIVPVEQPDIAAPNQLSIRRRWATPAVEIFFICDTNNAVLYGQHFNVSVVPVSI
jgi:hypothetical protein